MQYVRVHYVGTYLMYLCRRICNNGTITSRTETRKAETPRSLGTFNKCLQNAPVLLPP